MDHDRLFKELLSTFFLEFVDLFLPKVARYLDRDFEVVPMSQEMYGELKPGERHIVDLLMKVKFRGEDAYFLIHIENQATAQTDFPKRMFKYFSHLTDKYDLPVYPVVIFSYDAPVRPEPTRYQVAFPDKTVLRFDYTVIQLNRLPWRRFLRQENPVATALMAKMKMRVKDRPKVKAQCLRVLGTLRLDPAKSELIYVFFDSYLKLTAAEQEAYDREIAAFTPAEREEAMELRSIWGIKGHEEGLKQGLAQGVEQGLARGVEQGLAQGVEQGLHEGKKAFFLRQMHRKLGHVPENMIARIDGLSSDDLDALGEAFLDFTNLSDLDQWFTQNS